MSEQWRHAPVKAHWGTANPAVASGTGRGVRLAFELTFDLLKRRIEAFLQLPLDGLDRTAQWKEIMRVGELR